MDRGVLILGSGMAGVTLARVLRKLDANIDIALIGADSGGFHPSLWFVAQRACTF